MRASSIVASLPLIVLAGCSSIVGGVEPDVAIHLSSEVGAPAIDRMEVNIGGRTFRLAGENGPVRRSATAPRIGDLTVHVRLIGQAGDTLAHTSFIQTFREDTDHWVAALVGESRPVGFCIGELTAIQLTDLSGTSPDTLFLMHGSIPQYGIC